MGIQWIKVFIIERLNAGTLTIPAPILTRVFQELDGSVASYHAAEKLSQIPFPFPYAATIELILIIHAVITPMVMMNLLTADNASENTFLPIPSVGIVIFFLWSLHFTAGELENPYDGDKNDLDLHGLQGDLNKKLQAICQVMPAHVPRLVVSPKESACLLKSASHTPSSSETSLRRRGCQSDLDGFIHEEASPSSCNNSEVLDTWETPRISDMRVRRLSSSPSICQEASTCNFLDETHVAHSKVEHAPHNQSRHEPVVFSLGEDTSDFVFQVTCPSSPRTDDGKTLKLPIDGKAKKSR